MVTLPITLKCNHVTKLDDHTHTHRVPFLLCWCGWLNNVGRFWADDGGCVGEAVLGSPRRGWLPLTDAAIGDALWGTDVCLSQGWEQRDVSNPRRMITRARDSTGTSFRPDGNCIDLDCHASVGECCTVLKHNISRFQRHRPRNTVLSRRGIVI